MALRVWYGGNSVVRAMQVTAGYSHQRMFLEAVASANPMEALFPMKFSGIARELRPNNDGPEWTRNREDTLPDLVRPIPFKELLALSAVRTFSPIPFIQSVDHHSPI